MVSEMCRLNSHLFQVMNYGIGGQISAHVDSMDVENTISGEYIQNAGPRIITFMMYLSDVIAGGRTVFPQLGISVKPKKGSALYWFNFHSDVTFDSRMLHFGCPVVFGNKWIANKWIKLNAQFKSHTCNANDNKTFSII